MSNWTGSTIVNRTPQNMRPFTFSPYGFAPSKVRVLGNNAMRGGMSFTSTVTKKRRRFGNYRSFASKVRKTMEAKHYSNSANFTLTHDTIYTSFPTRGIAQGTAVNQRIGDSIFLEAIKLKGAIRSPDASDAYRFRLIVGYSGEEIATTSNELFPVTPGLSSAELFIVNSASNGNINGIINSKACTVVYDETFDINSQVDAAPTIHSHDIVVQLKKNFPYQTNGSTFGKQKNLFVTCIAENASATGTAGLFQHSYDLIFKD